MSGSGWMPYGFDKALVADQEARKARWNETLDALERAEAELQANPSDYIAYLTKKGKKADD
jgi:hypothetical protein